MIFRKLHSIKICFTVNSWSPSHWSHNGGWGLFSILNECVKRVWPIRRRLIRLLKEWLYDKCAVELIAQRDKPNCLVEVSACRNQTIEMFRLHMDSDEVILNSYESTALTFQCPGETPRQQRVRGPITITMPKGCGVETAKWALSGIVRGQSAVHLPITKFR